MARAGGLRRIPVRRTPLTLYRRTTKFEPVNPPDIQDRLQQALGPAYLIERELGAPQSLEVKDLGSMVARGPLVAALQGADQGLGQLGISGTMRRVGFQAHDGRIFDTLTARGGVLVAIHSEPRAADALAVLHSYGGGNAAIGAWSGRV